MKYDSSCGTSYSSKSTHIMLASHSPGEDEIPSVVCSLGRVAQKCLLRGIELALLDWHSDTISFDMSGSTVTVGLSQMVTREDGPPLVDTSAGATNLAGCRALSVLLSFWSSWPSQVGQVLAALEVGRLRRQDPYHSSALVLTLVVSWNRLTWSVL